MIITLCGSARFEKEFKEWSWRLARLGHPVFGLSVYPSDRGGDKDWYTPEEKKTLDLIHLAKIKASDAVLVLNVDGYVGESTAREVEWARMIGRIVLWLEYNNSQSTNREEQVNDFFKWPSGW